MAANFAYGAVDNAFVQMMTAQLPAMGLTCQAGSMEKELPIPLLVGVRILAGQGEWERNPVAMLYVAYKDKSGACNLLLKGGMQRLRQNRYPIFHTLAIVNNDLPLCKIQVLDSQS